MAERQVAMVTGASRGIGRAGALALADHGFDVVVTGRTVHEGEGREGDVVLPGSLDRTVAEIEERGRRGLGVPMDVTDRTSVRAAFDAAVAEWGRIDVLVNNAPYSGPGYEARILEIDPDVAIRMAEANYVNQLVLTQLALPGMLEAGAGTIINLGSGSALVRPPAPAREGGWSLAYCATKAAFHQVAVLVDVEFRDQGIRAFTLEPGFTVTERSIALGRAGAYEAHFAGDPPEVAGAAIAWLATSPDADRFLGRIVHAQAACAKNNLLPGWPPPGREG
ncbi:MAG TPA: SDR family oxidoreductase [Acidimicrobiales bacterium]|nr:SDR family oxidoreductase [Acidimicrobiales bacterium]